MEFDMWLILATYMVHVVTDLFNLFWFWRFVDPSSDLWHAQTIVFLVLISTTCLHCIVLIWTEKTGLDDNWGTKWRWVLRCASTAFFPSLLLMLLPLEYTFRNGLVWNSWFKVRVMGFWWKSKRKDIATETINLVSAENLLSDPYFMYLTPTTHVLSEEAHRIREHSFSNKPVLCCIKRFRTLGCKFSRREQWLLLEEYVANDMTRCVALIHIFLPLVFAYQLQGLWTLLHWFRIIAFVFCVLLCALHWYTRKVWTLDPITSDQDIASIQLSYKLLLKQREQSAAAQYVFSHCNFKHNSDKHIVGSLDLVFPEICQLAGISKPIYTFDQLTSLF